VHYIQAGMAILPDVSKTNEYTGKENIGNVVTMKQLQWKACRLDDINIYKTSYLYQNKLVVDFQTQDDKKPNIV